MVCARLDWIENRKRCYETASEPVDLKEEKQEEAEEAEARQRGRGVRNCTRNADVLCVGDARAADKFLATANYVHTMPLIPPEELYASSIRHPLHPKMTWLLHTRRVPITNLDAPGSAEKPVNAKGSINSAEKPVLSEIANSNSPEAAEHQCAGVGDIDAMVWMCPQCVSCLCRPAKDINMPPLALANGNWLGREHPLYQGLNLGTKKLLSRGRACWHKLILGKGQEAEQQKGITGNSIFLAQAQPGSDDVLPPSASSLQDSFVVLFARTID